MKWEILSKETLKAARFNIECEKVKLSEHHTFNFSHVAIRPGVCVLAISEQEDIVCIKQYRHAFKANLWELPAGAIDGPEQPIEAAKRELLEEAGAEAKEWTDLGYFYPSPGSTSEKIHLFIARKLSFKEQQLEQTEQIELHIITKEQFEALIESNQFLHGAGLAAYAKYKIKEINK